MFDAFTVRFFRSRRSLALWSGMLLGLLQGTASGAIPLYVREALDHFTPEVPAGWAYTVTTEQAQQKTTERYDPSKPPAEQWSLLKFGDHSPTEKEMAQYIKYKSSQAPGAARATYTKNDIEPFSLKLVQEDDARAEFIGTFREQSASADKMLAHLRIRLVVSKKPAYIEKSSIELIEPYSPVLTVKMNELIASIEFAAATDDRPSLPIRSSSHFLGRIFFFRVEETLRLTYQDFRRAP